MTGRNRGGFRRWLADFALALALFWSVAFVVSAHTHAHALPPLAKEATGLSPAVRAGLRAPEADRPFEPWHKAQAGPAHALLLLSLAFAALAACNLAIWRHLRRVYASPRRRGWRRG